MRRAVGAAWLAAGIALCCGAAAQSGDPGDPGVRLLDDFRDASAWTLAATDDVKATLRTAPGVDGRPALCIDYDFGRVTGYVTARRALPLDLPPRHAFELNLRGDGPPNDLQFKLVDASGDNVWWAPRKDVRWPAAWQPLRLRSGRDIVFAWGPTADRTLRHAASIEFVIVSGRGGGRGSTCFDRLVLRALPDVEPPLPLPRFDAATKTVDFGTLREFDALALRWRAGTAPSDYRVEASDDGAHWRTLRAIVGARGTAQRHWLPRSEARFVRVVLDSAASASASSASAGLPPAADAVQLPLGASEAATAGVTVRRLSGALNPSASPALEALEPESAANVDAWFASLARAAPRGRYPRAWRGEQAYWTVFGVDGGRIASLLGEDGAVEPVPGVGALEPFVRVDGHGFGWADATITHALRDDALPMPSVRWRFDAPQRRAADLPDPARRARALLDGLELDIDAFADGTPDAAQAIVRYTVRNRGAATRAFELALAWRPFQVNPPTQFLAHPGGVAEVARLDWDGRTLRVDGAPRLRPLVPPASVALVPLAAAAGPGEPVGRRPAAEPQTLTDTERYASAVLTYPLTIPPGAMREITLALPVAGAPVPPAAAGVAKRADRVAAEWHRRLDTVRLRGPAPVVELDRNVRAALGHILVNRSGPALQPGARAYARSWIRDGALTSAALLRLGHAAEVRAFLQWYAPFQFANGKVPCCATARGADPVPEHDSDGEFAYAVNELRRYTGDDATSRALWPPVRTAIAHQEALRAGERRDANRTPERAAYFGLMPPSISHEGYSDKPAWSYWDDFWAAIGDRSAVDLAAALGEREDAARLAAERDAFLADLRRSLEAATRRHGLDVLPGSADRGDVDPTSSTIALSPGGLAGQLPEGLARATFARWWVDFEARRADEAAGRRHGDGAYTPYEWRNVGALVRLGERDRALAAVDYFGHDRRPAGWRQWAEVVARDAREPRFLGDMPHGWVASDQIRAVLDLYAYEDEGAGRLVLAAGVPLGWFDRQGVGIAGLRTPWGPLGWHARRRPVGGLQQIDFQLSPMRSRPPGGLVLRGPWPGDALVRIGGRPVAGDAGSIPLPEGATKVTIVWRSAR